MKARTMLRLRRYHFYAGMFFTPAILLFALSGALQTFRLQEAKGFGGTPPQWIVWMASIHKNQALPGERERSTPVPSPAPTRPSGAQDHPERAAGASPLPLRIFVVVMSIGLIVSVLLGVAIALNSRSTRRTSLAILIGGTLLPLVLLAV